jgi:diguanylate cyclase (GGDEF)-like protein
VLVTASERISDLKDAVNVARVHRFLSKPIRPVELPNVVAAVIRERALEAENARLLEALEEKNTLLTRALAQVQENELRLEREVEQRTRDLREAISELEKLALRDGLTGLYNHRFFQEALTTELSRAARYTKPVSLLFIDVDHFKSFNDINGHPAGDKVLKRLAAILTDTGEIEELPFRGRASDITARYGGEEFVVILPETDRDGAAIRAERIRASLEAWNFPGQENQPDGNLTVSIGVASYPVDALTKGVLVEAADSALLEAKRAGRNRVHIFEAPADEG